MKRHSVMAFAVYSPPKPPEWRRPASLPVWVGYSPDRKYRLLIAAPHLDAARAALGMSVLQFNRCNFFTTTDVTLLDLASHNGGLVFRQPIGHDKWEPVYASYDIRP